METTIKDILRAAGIEESEMNVRTAAKAVEFMNNDERRAQHIRLQSFVGKYVKVGNEFGMIDEVIDTPYSVALGFITSDGDTWTGRVVDEHDVSPVSGEEVAKCIKAATEYCVNEVVYLTHRIAHHYKIDEPYLSKMQANLHHLDLLLGTLTNNLSK